MSKHTKGPWVLNILSSGSFGLFPQPSVNGDQKRIATIHKNTSALDARLIAAAPELLETLKAICRATEFTVSMRVEAEKAIFKAEG